MALLDFSRFGITPADIQANRYSYIIGFDLGDGEISAAYWNLRDEGVTRPTDLRFNSNGETKILSGLFVEKNGKVSVGPLGVMQGLIDAEGELYLNFKVDPDRLAAGELYEGTDRTKKELMQTMFRRGIEEIIASEPISKFEGKGILAVGCPSSEEWTANGRDEAYAAMLAEAVYELPLDLSVVVIPESRASLLKVYKERSGEIGSSLSRGVVVVDHGSSTLDMTVIDFSRNSHNDFSVPLGAKKIERGAMRQILAENGNRMSEVVKAGFQVLNIRGGKEAHYVNPLSSPRIFIDLADGDFVKARLDKSFMYSITHELPTSYSTESDPNVTGTWSDLHRRFMVTSMDTLPGDFSPSQFTGTVMLTGGASRMQFTEENVRAVFPKAQVVCDIDPSYCVSSGLAWTCYIDLRSQLLIGKVKEEIREALRNDFVRLRGLIADKLTPMVYAFTRQSIGRWVENGDNVTPMELVKSVEKDFLDETTAGGRDRMVEVREAFKEAISEYLTKGESVRNIITDTVNRVFSQEFPGRVDAKNLRIYNIDDSEWTGVVESAMPDRLSITSSIIDSLDLESSLGEAIKIAIGLVILVATFALKLILFFLPIEQIFDKLDMMFNKNRTLSKADRQKAYDNLCGNETEVREKIRISLASSRSDSDTEQLMAQRMIDALGPSIDNAVNVVSLYF